MIARRALRFKAAGSLTLALALMGGLVQPALARTAAKAHVAPAAPARVDGDKAIAMAEAAVAAAPRDAAARATLGRTYLKNGRFQSAATALSDAVTLGDNSGRTLLALALAQVGNGQNNDALRTLEMGNNVIPVADLGLALALAGEGDKGSLLLADALRAGDKSDKLRANLGYAYALAGRWAESRTIVAMDLPADKVDARMTQWAQAARPEAGRERVASLLGVAMAPDGGMPMQLALNKTDGAVQMASADPAPMSAPAVAAAAPAAEAPAAEAPVAQTMPAAAELPAAAAVAFPAVASPAPAAESSVAPMAELPAVAQAEPAITPPAPVFHAIPAPMGKPVTMAVRTARIAKTKAKPAAEAMAEPRPAAGTHALQLGSFLSEKNALRAKKAFLGREKSFADADVAITKATVDNREFWRVSVRGFSAAAANSKCAAIRKSGGACLAYSGNLPGGTQAHPQSRDSSAKALAMAAPKAQRGR